MGEHITETSTEVDTLNQNAASMQKSSKKTADTLAQLCHINEEVERIIGEVKEQTDRTNASIQKINAAMEFITSIAEETNLLSLNASIEAARAGEAGRGFAVVAEEIRKLADNSAEAAGEIRNNVENISAQTGVSVESAKQAGEMVAQQTEAVREVIGVFQDMSDAMDKLFDGLKEILAGTERADKEREDTLEAGHNISSIIEETAASAEVVKKVAASLEQNVENLNGTAESLGDNMTGLKTEIAVFKTE